MKGDSDLSLTDRIARLSFTGFSLLVITPQHCTFGMFSYI